MRRRVARGEHQSDRVVDRCLVNRDTACRLLKADHIGWIQQAGGLGLLVGHPADDRALLGWGRIVDRDSHQKPVALRLGERIDALRLDGVLGGHHQERLWHGEGASADRDLPLRHRLEERRLDPCRGG